MSADLPQDIIADQVGRMTQVIVAALIMGLVIFGAIAFSVGQEKAAQLGIISSLAAVVFVINVFVSLILSKTATARALRDIAATNPEDWRQALAPIYARKLILSDAPLEGAGFFNGVAYLIEGHWMSLAIMISLAALMAITFPSQAHFETWAEQIQREYSS